MQKKESRAPGGQEGTERNNDPAGKTGSGHYEIENYAEQRDINQTET